MLVLLSGMIGSGKTTLCLRLVDLARQRGLCVAGALTPAVIEDGVKVGIEAVDLRTSEVRLLARGLVHKADESKGTRMGQYVFCDLTLGWMVAFCTKALADTETHRGSLVFVDEIGMLELDRGEGLAPLIPLLAQPRDSRTVVIVRDTLLDRLRARVTEAGPHVVVVDPQCREVAWAEMASLVLGDEAGL